MLMLSHLHYWKSLFWRFASKCFSSDSWNHVYRIINSAETYCNILTNRVVGEAVETVAELLWSPVSNSINITCFQELTPQQALTVTSFEQPRRTLQFAGKQSCAQSHVHARHANVPRQCVHQGEALQCLGRFAFSWLNNGGVGRVRVHVKGRLRQVEFNWISGYCVGKLGY